MNAETMTTEQRRLVECCKTELAINFDCPAPQILRVYGAKLGLTEKGMRNLLGSLIEA